VSKVAKSVKLSNQASKAVDKADPPLRQTIKRAIQEIAVNPLIGIPLQGLLKGLRRYRVGSYSIVYRFTEEVLEIVSINHRKDAYR
jgi:addiction module RelE/StbE family toxin